MKIAITQRIEYVESYKEYRDAIDHRLIKLVTELGHYPILIPNSIYEIDNGGLLKKWLLEYNPEGVIFSGGNDLFEFKNRDQTEKYLYNWAETKNLPVLGICRGMQMIGFINGVRLKKVKNHNKGSHIIINKETNEKLLKNSFHNYSLSECPEGFEITSLSTDNQIESISHLDKRIVGVMWHPERESKVSIDDYKLFKKLYG